MRREDDLIDVWFDSGSMPYAQLHYPFEGEICKDGLAKTGLTEDEYRKQLISSSYSGTAVPPAFYPADFINEGVDQTRGVRFGCVQERNLNWSCARCKGQQDEQARGQRYKSV